MVYRHPVVIINWTSGNWEIFNGESIASDWQLPLLKLDVGKLFGGIVENSRLRQMISVANYIPCILWIDEIDKALLILKVEETAVQVTVLATFISWLSEK
jgi:AAA+ superfamily predicted ATPase